MAVRIDQLCEIENREKLSTSLSTQFGYRCLSFGSYLPPTRIVIREQADAASTSCASVRSITAHYLNMIWRRARRISHARFKQFARKRVDVVAGSEFTPLSQFSRRGRERSNGHDDGSHRSGAAKYSANKENRRPGFSADAPTERSRNDPARPTTLYTETFTLDA
jgi:hypothetical protein